MMLKTVMKTIKFKIITMTIVAKIREDGIVKVLVVGQKGIEAKLLKE